MSHFCHMELDITLFRPHSVLQISRKLEVSFLSESKVIECRSATSCCHGDEASGSKQNYTCFAYKCTNSNVIKTFRSKVALFK